MCVRTVKSLCESAAGVGVAGGDVCYPPLPSPPALLLSQRTEEAVTNNTQQRAVPQITHPNHVFQTQRLRLPDLRWIPAPPPH